MPSTQAKVRSMAEFPAMGSLRGRFYAAFAGLAFLTGAVGAHGAFLVGRVGDQAQFAAQVATPVLAENGVLHETTVRLHGFVLDVVSGTGSPDTDARYAELDGLAERSLKRIAQLLRGDPSIASALDAARQRHAAYRGRIEEARRLDDARRTAKATLDARLAGFLRERAVLQARLTQSTAEVMHAPADAPTRLRRLALALDLSSIQEIATRIGGGSLVGGEDRVLDERLADIEARAPSLAACREASPSPCDDAIDGLRGTLLGPDGALAARAALTDLDRGMERLRQSLDAAESAYTRSVDAIGDIVRERMWKSRMAGEEAVAWGRWTAAGAAVLALGLALSIAVGFSRRVLAPAGLLTTSMLRLAEGDLDAAVPERATADEFGEMARALRVFRENALRRRELEGREAQLREEALLAEARQRTQDAIRLQNERFDAALSNMSQGLAVFDADLRMVVCNARYAALFGYPDDLTAAGTPLRDLIGHRFANGSVPQGICVDAFAARAIERGSDTQDLVDGRSLHVRREPTPDGGWVVTYEDITESRRSMDRIRHMAAHDALTNLLNRTSMREILERGLRDLGHGRGIAVHCLDLDRFKLVNDTHGHPVGDALLREVANRLSACADDASVARLGGDEFSLIQRVGSPGEAETLAERIVRDLSAPYTIGRHRVTVGTSVGIALAFTPAADADALIKQADIALYQAKSEGRGRHAVFASTMEAAIRDRQALEEDLRQACRENAFDLYYQPLVSFADGRVTSFEALLRWRHPVRGYVSPADFIPIAEETGLIGRIGAWAIRRACRDAARWPADVKVAVNLSPEQFKLAGDIVTVVGQALADHDLHPTRLGLEITESVLLDEGEQTMATLHALRRMGVTISLDDFGTGFSSLSYLLRFPFDRLKIDQTFVREMLKRENCASIVNSVISLAGELGMTCVAEGVETREQYERLRADGCGEAQGYLISHPVPASDVPGIIAARLRIPAGEVPERAAGASDGPAEMPIAA
jgi:diguanylate cyclase (GGDEF)-like protein